MRRPAGVLLLAVLFLASCAGPSARRIPPAPDKAGELLSAVQAAGPIQELSDDERLALETAAWRVLAAGAPMVAPLLEEIRRTSDQQRRLVLIKILFLTVDRMRGPVTGRDVYYRQIEKTGRALLASSDSLDRYTGYLLISIPYRSEAVPTAIRMLEDEDAANRGFAIAVLKQVTAVDLGFRAAAAENERKAAVGRWRTWWRRNKGRDMYYQPAANPVLQGLRLDTHRVSRTAGPYPLEVRDGDGNSVPAAIIAYSYHFTTPDAIGKNVTHRATADGKGKVLLAAESAGEDMRFIGAELIVSRMGYQKAALTLAPHFLTPNSFSIVVTLEKE